MPERPADPTVLGRIAANRPVLARLADGARRSSGGVGPWSPDGYVMRTHPDFTEVVERVAPDDLRMVYGVATLVDPDERIYAVAWGMGYLWLRVPSGPAFDDAIAGGVATAVDELEGWVVIHDWSIDLGPWIRASSALTRELVPLDA
jgi:hypothetical protein